MCDDSEAVGLSVGQVAARLGVTVRTLHHWDEIGLAKPSTRTSGGYRFYTADDLQRLHRIVVYRELGVGLPGIRDVLDEATTDVSHALREQRDRVNERIEHLQNLSAGLERMIEAHERGLLLTLEQQAVIFGPRWNPDWPAQARRTYGDTAQWHQFAERAATRDADDWQDLADAQTRLDRALADAMGAGVSPGSPDADDLVERHRATFSSYFPLTRQMQVCLARRFEADPDYVAHYDGIRPGLAAWFRRIVDASARAHGIDPDTAQWE